jgi:hypothetical protein
MQDGPISLLGRIDLWIDVGRGLIDLVLIYAMYLVVMTVLGHPKPWKLHTKEPRTPETGSPRAIDGPSVIGHKPTSPPTQSARHDLHLEIIDALKQSRQLQGATIVLVVFAVLILGINGVLNGAETGTILAGITGYVLGTRPIAADHQSDSHNSDGDGSSGPHRGEPAATAKASPEDDNDKSAAH